MEIKLELKRQGLLVNDQRPRLGLEIHNNKIIPVLRNNILEQIQEENEWAQEYYIIYNSYVLEEKEY